MRPSSLSVRSLEGRPRRALHGAACLVDRRHVSSPRIGDGSINLPQREGDFLLFQLTKQVHHKKSRDGGITPHERIRRDSFHPGVTSSDSRRKKEFYLSRVSYLNDRQEEVSHDRLFRRYAIDSSVFNPVISSPSSSPCSSHPSQPSSSKDFMRRSFCPTRDLSFPSLFSPCDVLSSSPLHYAPFNHSFKHRSLLSRSIRLSFLSFSSLPSTSSSSSSSSGCRRRPRDSSRSDVEGVGRERNTSRKLPLSSSSSSPVSSSSSVSSPFSYVSKTVVRNDGDEGERTTGSRFQYRGRLAGGIASASLLLALAFRKWAQEQEEKRKGMWWLSSSSPSSSSSLSSLSGHSSSSFSSAFEDRPAQPHPFIPVEDSCKSTPHQVANLPPSGVYTPEQSSEDDTILEGIRTFLSPLGPVDLSSSSVSLSSLSPVNQLATSLAVSLSSRFKKLSWTPPFPQGGETSSTEKREEGAAYQQEDPGKPREGKEEGDYDESTRKDAFELLRNILYGRPVRVETLGDLEEEEDEEEHDEGKERRKDERRKDSCIVQLHDCRVLASKEGRMALEEILKATGTIDLTATEYEGLDDEDRKAWDVIKGGNDKTVMELWQSAAFRKIVETWRRQAFKEGFVGDVLEIGIGKGKTMGDPDLQKSCCSYTGIDVRLLDEAKQNAVEFSSPPNHNNHRHPHASSSSDLPFPITLLEADAQNLPFPPDSFDCAVSQRVLCSVESPPCVISSVLRVLRPGGRMVFFEHGSLHPSLSRELLSSASSSSSDSSRLHQKKETSDKQHESPRRKHMKRQGQAPGEEAKGDRERGVDEDEEEMDRTSPIRGQAWGTTVMNGLNSWI
ncbi:methyltransferase type 11, partial [Cystoisospora suis]